MDKTVDAKQIRHEGIMHTVFVWWIVIIGAIAAFWVGLFIAFKLFIELLLK